MNAIENEVVGYEDGQNKFRETQKTENKIDDTNADQDIGQVQ